MAYLHERSFVTTGADGYLGTNLNTPAFSGDAKAGPSSDQFTGEGNLSTKKTAHVPKPPSGALDKRLLDEAIDVLESIDFSLGLDVLSATESLSGLICELWSTAADASPYHQVLLAAIESAVIQARDAERLTESQAAALRSGFIDLKSPVVTESHVESLSSRLVDESFSPFAPIDDLNGTDAIDE